MAELNVIVTNEAKYTDWQEKIWEASAAALRRMGCVEAIRLDVQGCSLSHKDINAPHDHYIFSADKYSA